VSAPAGRGLAPIRTLRPLAAADLDGVSRVHWRACRIAYRFLSWSYTLEEVRCWYAGKLCGWDWGRVVTVDGAIVAYLAAIGSHVDQLFVDPDHQRTGLGRLLLEAMLERRPEPITLHVFAENQPARRFYERFGFQPVESFWDAQDEALSLVYRLDRDPAG
jgi:ribosomal protein S18 acetylase RimI-like enzyme